MTYTKAQIDAKIASNIPDNITKYITPALTREVLSMLNNKIGATRLIDVEVIAHINVVITSLKNGDTIGGIPLSTGDNVFLAAQTVAADNGIYVVGATAGTTVRHADYAAIDACLNVLLIVLNGGNAFPLIISNISDDDIWEHQFINCTKIKNCIVGFSHEMQDNEFLDKIKIKYIDGTPLVRVGLSLGGEEFLEETEITDYVLLKPEKYFASAGTLIYFQVTGGTVDIKIEKLQNDI